jgi:hypothetical protein
MKGVVLQRCPGARIVDLTHDIAPQDLLEAALFLSGSVPHFPRGCVHVVVVDPGVGTARHPIAASAGGWLFVCPDNGCLTLLAGRYGMDDCRIIAHPDCFEPEVSSTFHGRDVFAPTAALLACGFRLERVGPRLEEPVRLEIPQPRRSGGCVTGEIIHIDRFGNCITNIPVTVLDEIGPIDERAAGVRTPGGRPLELHAAYGEVPPGVPLALWGSSGYLEAAVNGGSAELSLGLARGDRISLEASGRTGAATPRSPSGPPGSGGPPPRRRDPRGEGA